MLGTTKAQKARKRIGQKGVPVGLEDPTLGFGAELLTTEIPPKKDFRGNSKPASYVFLTWRYNRKLRQIV